MDEGDGEDFLGVFLGGGLSCDVLYAAPTKPFFLLILWGYSSKRSPSLIEGKPGNEAKLT